MAKESTVEQHQVSHPGVSGTKLTEWAQQYSVEASPLGRGSFASVYKGVNRKTGEQVAIKVMTKTRLGEKALQMLAAEISILRTLEHPNVVCFRDSHTTERRILIVLEFCGGGDLGQFIQSRGPSPEDTARHFMLQLAAGLAFLRSRRLIHRDIKPQNLLLSEKSPRAILKIADFGLARHLPQGSLAESMLGSPLYMAPEVLSNRAYDAKADLWSAGAVLYELLTAKHPFGGTNQVELINNIRRNRPRLPPGVTLSREARELLGILLVPRPSERASLQAFLSCNFLNPDPRGGSRSRDKAPSVHGDVSDCGNEQSASPTSLPPTDRMFDPSTRGPTSPSGVGSRRPGWSPERERGCNVVQAAVGNEQSRAVIPTALPGKTRVDKSRTNCKDLDVGVRHGEWEWGGEAAVGIGLGFGVGGSGREGCGIAEEGALPALPSLPFALGLLDAPRSARCAGERESKDHGEAGDVDGGVGECQLAPDFVLDLAFAENSPEDRSEPIGITGLEDKGRRKDTVPVASPAAAGPSPVSPAFRRSNGSLDASSAEQVDRANTFSASPDLCKLPTRSGLGNNSSRGNGGGGDADLGGPQPVFFLGKEDSVSEPSASPAHSRPSVLDRRVPSEHMRILTPSSSLLHADANCGSGGDSGRCDGGYAGIDRRVINTSPSGTPRCDDNRTPGAHAHLPPVAYGRQLAGPPPPLPPAFADGSQSQHQPSSGLSGGGGSAYHSDGGVPMITKYPSLRSGGDSLLTIPEDSTGFVLVTRPSSSISCEHGPSCECWAWCAGGGGAGGGAGTIRSPSASYLKAANPYGGPSKAERRSGPGAFLGSVGNIWNTAMNTFRGVAGANGRRSSFPATRGGRASQQRRGSSPNILHKQAVADDISGRVTATKTAAAGAAGASPLASPREQVSPVSAQRRNMGVGVPASAARSSNVNNDGGSISSGSGSRDSSGTQVVGVGTGISNRCGSRDLIHNQGAPLSVERSAHRTETLRYGGFSDDVTGRRQPPQPHPRDADYPFRLSHERRHSDPIPPRSYPAAISAAIKIDSGGGRTRCCSSSEEADSRRVMAAADRAEVVGKRSILIVTLADKIAQEAMSLALESPRDAYAGENPLPPQWRAQLRLEAGTGAKSGEVIGIDHSAGVAAYARRRHDMLTEALALYVRALAILQGALPGVLFECGGVHTEELAAWNALSIEPTRPIQPRFHHPPQQQQQQKRVGRPSPPSPALLTLQSALVTKSSWLKELFSQTLQRAEHCREQAVAASAARKAAAAAAMASASECTTAQSTAEPLASAPGEVTTQFSKDSDSLTPPSDTAAAAVFRSAMEHGQEAAVCYLLGRSDAAVAHYVRACALLHLLALEPEMSGMREDAFRGGSADPRSLRAQKQQQQPKLSGWKTQLLLMADGYAQRVETITRGDVKNKAEQECAVRVPAGKVEDEGVDMATVPPEIMNTVS